MEEVREIKRRTSRKNLPFRINKKTITHEESFRNYRKQSKAAKKPYVNIDTYKAINREFNQVLVDFLISTGDNLKLTPLMGSIRICKHKIPEGAKRKLKIRVSDELGKPVFFNNKHSNGYYAFVKWSRKRGSYYQSKIFDFTFTVTNRRKLSEAIIKDNTINKYLIR